MLRSALTINLFQIEDRADPGSFLPLGFAELRSKNEPVNRFPEAAFNGHTYNRADKRQSGSAVLPSARLPYQEALLPKKFGESIFLPDPRVWTALCAWRMPGFDVGGNGFIGFDRRSFNRKRDINGKLVQPNADALAQPSTDVKVIEPQFRLDGTIDPPFPLGNGCGCAGLAGAALAVVGFCCVGSQSARRRRMR